MYVAYSRYYFVMLHNTYNNKEGFFLLKNDFFLKKNWSVLFGKFPSTKKDE